METTTIIIIILICTCISSSIGVGIYLSSSSTTPSETDAADTADTPGGSTAPVTAPVAAPVAETVFKLAGCEAEEANLKCSNGKIKTAKIKYGRWDNNTCPHPTITPTTQSNFKEYT